MNNNKPSRHSLESRFIKAGKYFRKLTAYRRYKFDSIFLDINHHNVQLRNSGCLIGVNLAKLVFMHTKKKQVFEANTNLFRDSGL